VCVCVCVCANTKHQTVGGTAAWILRHRTRDRETSKQFNVRLPYHLVKSILDPSGDDNTRYPFVAH